MTVAMSSMTRRYSRRESSTSAVIVDVHSEWSIFGRVRTGVVLDDHRGVGQGLERLVHGGAGIAGCLDQLVDVAVAQLPYGVEDGLFCGLEFLHFGNSCSG